MVYGKELIVYELINLRCNFDILSIINPSVVLVGTVQRQTKREFNINPQAGEANAKLYICKDDQTLHGALNKAINKT